MTIMKNIIDIINGKENLYFGKPASAEEIMRAEQELQLCFDKEYKEYVLRCGVISYGSHELTGICPYSRLDVVSVTKEERENNPLVPADSYVIEQTHIDRIVIWQNSRGEILQTGIGTEPKTIEKSLSDYIEKY